nr:25 kda protein p25, peptide F4 [cattle, brain, Peptide Partial, 11 aa] [Bos taurus]
KERFDPSGRGK